MVGQAWVAGLSGIAQTSSPVLPQTVQEPNLSLIIGLLVEQVPLNSFPVMMCLILISAKETPNTTKMISKVVKNSIIRHSDL